MSTCETCRYWSDRVAMMNAHGELVALCLVPTVKDAAGICKYTHGHQTCESHAAGPSVDLPLAEDAAA